MDRPPGLARAKTVLRNISAPKRAVKKVLRFDGRGVVLCDLQKKKPLDLSGFSNSISIIA
jgi:hypothetical protein